MLDFDIAAAGIHGVGSSVAKCVVRRVDAALQWYGFAVEVDKKLGIPVFLDDEAFFRYILTQLAWRAVEDGDDAHFVDLQTVQLD